MSCNRDSYTIESRSRLCLHYPLLFHKCSFKIKFKLDYWSKYFFFNVKESSTYFPNVFFNKIQLLEKLDFPFVFLFPKIGQLEQPNANKTTELAEFVLKIGRVSTALVSVDDHLGHEESKRAQVDLFFFCLCKPWKITKLKITQIIITNQTYVSFSFWYWLV